MEAKINRKGDAEETMATSEVWTSQIYAFKARGAEGSYKTKWSQGPGERERKGGMLTRPGGRRETKTSSHFWPLWSIQGPLLIIICNILYTIPKVDPQKIEPVSLYGVKQTKMKRMLQLPYPAKKEGSFIEG